MEKTSEMEGPDLERIGLFKEMSYLEEHVPIKIEFNASSKKGKQMMTHCSRHANATMDGYFDKSFLRVFEGEGYADPVRTRRLQRLEEAKKNLTKHFKYTSPTKKPCGSGTNYGTFGLEDGKKLEHFSTQPKEVEPGSSPKRNFYVNPPKKGTGYGYPNVTISKVPPYFLDQEYEDLKNARAEEMSEKRESPEEREFEPYRAGTFQQGFFDPNPYLADEQEDEEEDEDDGGYEEEDKKIFLPAGPAKKDGGMKDGCLSKFPEYVGDPYPKVDYTGRGVKRYVNNQNKMFRPVPGPKPYPIKSIITKNVQRKVTPQNFTTIKGVVYCKDKKNNKILK